MATALTEHFSLEELCRSDEATRLGIANDPSSEIVHNLTNLCIYILEPLRLALTRPVRIRSGFRCPQVNQLVGGAATSQHLYGQAADIEVDGMANSDVWKYIADHLPFDQVIAEHLSAKDGGRGWVHVSYADAHRKSKLSCVHGTYVPGLVFEV